MQTIAIRRAAAPSTRMPWLRRLLDHLAKLADRLVPPERAAAEAPPPEWFRYPLF